MCSDTCFGSASSFPSLSASRTCVACFVLIISVLSSLLIWSFCCVYQTRPTRSPVAVGVPALLFKAERALKASAMSIRRPRSSVVSFILFHHRLELRMDLHFLLPMPLGSMRRRVAWLVAAMPRIYGGAGRFGERCDWRLYRAAK